jgi:hypothetical protein
MSAFWMGGADLGADGIAAMAASGSLIGASGSGHTSGKVGHTAGDAISPPKWWERKYPTQGRGDRSIKLRGMSGDMTTVGTRSGGRCNALPPVEKRGHHYHFQ